jgi:membrane protease YdiL (CAAX protease family)
MSAASIPLHRPQLRLRDRLLAHPLVRFVLALLSVVVPIAITLGLSGLVPKPWRAGWPALLAACAAVAGYRLYVRKVEKRSLDELSLAGAWKELGSGMGLGTLLVLACTLALMAVGVYSVTGTADPSVMLKPLPEQVLVAFFEELLFRAVVFRLLEKSWGTSIALAVSTLLFALAHLPNEHFSVMAALMTAVAASTLAAGYLVTRRLWLPIGLHFAWNYLFDAVLSIPVSGNPARGWVQIKAAGPEWLSGGAYGIEASVVTLVAWGGATVLLLVLARRRGHWLRKA